MVLSTRTASFLQNLLFCRRRMMTAAAGSICCPPFGASLLLPGCGDRAWYLRHSRLLREFFSKKQENSTVLLCFFGGSQTLLCCGDRAWYLRHSRLIREFFCFVVFRLFWFSLGCLGVAPLGDFSLKINLPELSDSILGPKSCAQASQTVTFSLFWT